MAAKTPKIFIVDDTPSNLRYLRAVFDGEGFSVSVAESGEQALSQAADNLPDLVLLDLRLPGMGGTETLSKLKTNRGRAAGYHADLSTGRDRHRKRVGGPRHSSGEAPEALRAR
jgi:CheY-like chemotaxis protein